MKPDPKLRSLGAAIRLGRLAQPSELAGVGVFVLSEKAPGPTSTTVFADGGIMHSSVGL